ncbi:hypothetical protein PENSPDRAFT_682199 [Peniophora sp. CONT]|nr:hypothetical protein PENSPDRAFT_682199 [Peniophora sp. CONT]
MNDPRFPVAYQQQVWQQVYPVGYAPQWQVQPRPLHYGLPQAQGYMLHHVPQIPQHHYHPYGHHEQQYNHLQPQYAVPPAPAPAPQPAHQHPTAVPAHTAVAHIGLHPVEELERLVASVAVAAAQDLMARTRRPEPCDKFDRLVAVAICARTLGQSLETAMDLIDGAHGFTAAQWALYMLCRDQEIKRVVDIIQRPLAVAAPAAVVRATGIAVQKRARSESTGEDSDTDTHEPERKRRRSTVSEEFEGEIVKAEPHI